MRRIDLTDYTVSLPNTKAGEERKNEEGSIEIEPARVDLPYHVKDSLIEVLLARDNQLTGTDLLDRDIIARKVNDCTDGSILLEEDEYNKLVISINTVKGLGRPDVEFVHRILDAPKLEVEEKKK